LQNNEERQQDLKTLNAPLASGIPETSEARMEQELIEAII
jgi:hypothetical protein